VACRERAIPAYPTMRPFHSCRSSRPKAHVSCLFQVCWCAVPNSRPLCLVVFLYGRNTKRILEEKMRWVAWCCPRKYRFWGGFWQRKGGVECNVVPGTDSRVTSLRNEDDNASYRIHTRREMGGIKMTSGFTVVSVCQST